MTNRGRGSRPFRLPGRGPVGALLMAASWSLAMPASAWEGEALCAIRHAPEPVVATFSADACIAPSPTGEPADSTPIPWTKPVTPAVARQAYIEARQLIAAGAHTDALLQLRVVEHGLPRIADRIALEQGDLLMALGQPGPAYDAYGAATASLDRGVSVRARVGEVRCLLASDAPEAESRLDDLLWRYPHLSERDGLRLELARHRMRRGKRGAAVALLRAIDLSAPTSPAAELARTELEALRAAGVFVRRWTAEEEVQRSDRIVHNGSPAEGRQAVDALLSRRGLSTEQRARADLLRARVARVEGRWADVTAALAQARAHGANAAEVQKLSAPIAPTREDDSKAAEQQRRWARQRIGVIVAGRAMSALKNPQLRRVVALAAQYELADEANAAMAAMAARDSVSAPARFEAGILTAGMVDASHTAAVLAKTIDVPRYRVSGRYHYARALERAGRGGEAEAQYLTVMALDDSDTRYYAMWADQRLWALHDEADAACGSRGQQGAAAPAATAEEEEDEAGVCTSQGSEMAALDRLLSEPTLPPEGTGSWPLPRPPVDGAQDPEGFRRAALKALKPIAKRHGDAYPWLWRAIDLIVLERFDEAADELNETYLAYRDAQGSPRLRSGLLAMYTGEAPARRPMDWALRHARTAMSERDRQRLAEIAAWLGDPGISLRFKGFRPDLRPRAYADEVQAAAAEYDLDPNLLFAVMRVESIYNRRIISYAGAVGLMQIMPRTGKLIAERVGYAHFDVSDLLDPRTNVRFAAWYLSSLLKRFEGRLPLAIASYNGGPHNVRLWMRAHNANMPLDAFLERIPFSQTHRYVRRVLTHYAAYRAQSDLPMTRLSLRLPDEKPDELAF